MRAVGKQLSPMVKEVAGKVFGENGPSLTRAHKAQFDVPQNEADPAHRPMF